MTESDERIQMRSTNEGPERVGEKVARSTPWSMESRVTERQAPSLDRGGKRTRFIQTSELVEKKGWSDDDESKTVATKDRLTPVQSMGRVFKIGRHGW